MSDLQLSGGKLFYLGELSIFIGVVTALTAGICERWKKPASGAVYE